MIDESKISNRPEHELSMDEILSSIRNIITEDQEAKPELRRTFPEDSTTNPSGARMMEGLPKFDAESSFTLIVKSIYLCNLTTFMISSN